MARIRSENFKVAGLNYAEEALKNIAIENDDYDLSKRELYELASDGLDCPMKVFKYEYNVRSCELKAEPDNEFDKNAIAVIADGEKIGYIKKGSTSRVRNLLKSEAFQNVTLEIYGGDYKYLSMNGEDMDDLDYDCPYKDFSVEKDSSDIKAVVTIHYRSEEEENATPAPAVAETAKVAPEVPAKKVDPPAKQKQKEIVPKKGTYITLMVLAILLLVMSVVLLLASPVAGILGIAFAIFIIYAAKKYKPPKK